MKYVYEKHDTFPVDNYFGIPNATQLHCHIKEFTTSLSNLVIGVSGLNQSNERYYAEIVFVGTRIINAPKEWVSANFQLVNPERCIKELRTLSIFDGLPDDDLLQNRMYSVELEKREIVIIAGDANLLTTSELKVKYGR